MIRGRNTNIFLDVLDRDYWEGLRTGDRGSVVTVLTTIHDSVSFSKRLRHCKLVSSFLSRDV